MIILSRTFNPYYDSEFLISTVDKPKDNRYLVELDKDELVKLKFEINTILKTSHKAKNKNTDIN